MTVYEKVYHCSRAEGLSEIRPVRSTHGEEWVYAAWDLSMAAVFLGCEGGDFTCGVGRDDDTGLPYICERFEGAFDLRYTGVDASIYVLPGHCFQPDNTQWDEELVCPAAVTPLEEIRVADAKAYLLELADAGKLIIKYYPDRVAGIPEDDEDLVFRTAIWYPESGEEVLEQLGKYHPGLVARARKAIEDGRYSS